MPTVGQKITRMISNVNEPSGGGRGEGGEGENQVGKKSI